jgi:hypothetical protein
MADKPPSVPSLQEKKEEDGEDSEESEGQGDDFELDNTSISGQVFACVYHVLAQDNTTQVVCVSNTIYITSLHDSIR